MTDERQPAKKEGGAAVDDDADDVYNASTVVGKASAELLALVREPDSGTVTLVGQVVPPEAAPSAASGAGASADSPTVRPAVPRGASSSSSSSSGMAPPAAIVFLFAVAVLMLAALAR